MIIDRLDAANVANWLSGMADGVLEARDLLVPEDELYESTGGNALSDYASQFIHMAEAFSEFATTGKPLDWDSLDDHIGTDVIKPSEVFQHGE